MAEPIQQQLPLAIVQGEPLVTLPDDLFIPPEAMEVFLEAFEGPLDLLLYLIRKQKLDIVELPIYAITEQYLGYIEALTTLKIELASDYLVMASTLAEIKSRLLLPKPKVEGEQEEDPRALLIKQLQAYEVIKQAATELDILPRQDRDFFAVEVPLGEEYKPEIIPPRVTLEELAFAFSEVINRASKFKDHHVSKETLSTRERMSQILEKLDKHKFLLFTDLFVVSEGKAGVVVSFLAMLELAKEQLIELVQNQVYGEIHVRAKQGAIANA
ncbi:ScpA family protein [Paraferrimonas sp. SM1919]|uniref:segregation and condensation protein A n=1 Tax=Paraferrimonas sp. SM1919 TaxID=2662263 RepID=UPI0013D26900|nr:ScpA family protein [Paraferrimonas sp. SM1919]